MTTLDFLPTDERLVATGDYIEADQVVARRADGSDLRTPVAGWLVRAADGGFEVSPTCGRCGSADGSSHWVGCPDRDLDTGGREDDRGLNQ